MLVEQSLDEPAMLVGHQLLQVLDRRLVTAALADVLRRHHDVDAIGLAADVIVDPVELDLELLRREGERPEHTEASGTAHGSDDVTTMREGEQRDVDVELVADGRAHGAPPAG